MKSVETDNRHFLIRYPGFRLDTLEMGPESHSVMLTMEEISDIIPIPRSLRLSDRELRFRYNQSQN